MFVMAIVHVNLFSWFALLNGGAKLENSFK